MGFSSNPTGVSSERAFKGNATNGASGMSSGIGSGYTFIAGIVKEVISNPDHFLNSEHKSIDQDGNITSTEGEFGTLTNGDVFSGRVRADKNGKPFSLSIENNKFIDYMPINSIIVQIVDRGTSTSGDKPVIAFPFFPPHISLPVKPGEYVWLVGENNKGSEVYYWMCRKVGIRQLDDLNFTHLERQIPIYDRYDELFGLASQVITDDDLELVNNMNANINGSLPSEDSIDMIHKSSNAYNTEFTPEPVPRQVKKCSDLLIQGSNNSHIMLGVEKFEFEMFSDLNDEEGNGRPDWPLGVELENRSKYFSDIESSSRLNKQSLSPAIDICIGRKISDLLDAKDPTAEKAIAGNDINMVKTFRTDSLKNEQGMEIDKISPVRGIDQNLKEFKDLDPLNCLARIYMSNTSNMDNMFGIKNLSEDESEISTVEPSDVLGVGNYSGLVMYSANSRMIGSESVVLQTNNLGGDSGAAIYMSAQGEIILQAGPDHSGAKIVLESSGDIRLVPGENGIVKIGDFIHSTLTSVDDLATGLVPVAGSLLPGGQAPIPHNLGDTPVALNPIISGFASLVPGNVGNPVNGQYSSKLLIK